MPIASPQETAERPQTRGREVAGDGSSLTRFIGRRGWIVLAIPGLVFMAVVFVVGFVSLLWTSFDSAAGRGSFDAYTELFGSPAFWDAVLRTLRLSFLTVLGCLVVATPIAYFIARTESSRRDRYMLLILVPWLSSVVVRSFGWQIILGSHGVVNWTLLRLHIVEEPVTLVQNEFGILVGLISVLAPFMIITTMSSLLAIDVRLEESAALLGAGPFKIIRTIVVPLSRRGIATGCILVFLMSNAVVVTPLMLGGARSATVATMMYTQLLELYNFQQGAALAFILVVLVVPPTLMMTWWGQRSSLTDGKA